jgi:2-iminobutanoate/2-iminopropanoate deaminase
MPADRETITAAGAPMAAGPYVHAVRAGDLLFCSGQIALHPASGEMVGETPAEQARQCLENLAAICDAAGAALGDAVKIMIYTTDMAAFKAINEVYASFFTEDGLPARFAVGVTALPRDALVGMDAVVALPG